MNLSQSGGTGVSPVMGRTSEVFFDTWVGGFHRPMSKFSAVIHALGWIVLSALTTRMWVRPPWLPGESSPPSGRSILKDCLYRSVGSHQAKLDVYLPADRPQPAAGGTPVPARPGSARQRPAVLAIHGGSWIGGSKAEYGPQVARLAQHGYVVFVADYRLARPGDPSWPEALEDLREAVRWIRRHAAEYHIDPERIAALGCSSGGHLAALLGTLPPEAEAGGVSCRVQAVVSLYGPTDLLALINGRSLAHDPARILLGESAPERLAQAPAASPLTHVTSDDAPMLLIHGSDDGWVPLEQSRRMAERLDQAGVKHRLLVVPGARHGFEFLVKFPHSRDLLPEILAFLENVWQVY